MENWITTKKILASEKAFSIHLTNSYSCAKYSFNQESSATASGGFLT
jgi:hypothetical protein